MNRNRFRGSRGAYNRYEKKIKPDSNGEDTVVVKCFRKYAEELNDKHDRYERIVKHSRDITIESKRLIFLLHSVDFRKLNSEKSLSEAFNRLMALCSTHFLSIAKEIAGHDQYQYIRAYSAGLQEFIEAYTYFDYLGNNSVADRNGIQRKLTYELNDNDSGDVLAKSDGETIEGELPNTNSVQIECFVQPNEFMLGLADLSGEIMRKCVNSLGSGDVLACQKACKFVQDLYSGFLCLGPCRNREMSRKVYTMHQSVLKVENVCYNVKVRGKEAAKWTANDAIDKQDDEDAGFVSY